MNETQLNDKIRSLESELEEVKNQIAQEIHDSLAQTLASLKLRTEVLEKNLHRHNADDRIIRNAAKVRHGIDLANKEIRELIKNFRAPKIESFKKSVENLIKTFESETTIKIFLQYNCSSLPFDVETKTNIYRIIQEALSNIKKHSNAKFVRMLLSCQEESLNILLEDDGDGFSPDKVPHDPEKHIGLAVMRERAQRISGDLDIESEKNEGCRIKLSISMPTQDTVRL